MIDNIITLSTELESALKYNPISLPHYITNNINKKLRSYQTKALQHYLLQRQNPSTNHLMFNMATGSGKTLIMAALMLDCYARGFRDFVFFVNSSAVLEKTKANFCDDKSHKYLFVPKIIINNEYIQINTISSLDESKENAINIYFSTIQGLYSLFTNERENTITLADLKDKKLVFLADEAHHLNANTKNKNNDDEMGWEGVIKNAFESNDDNLLFEFSATIPNERAVKEKYADKNVFEYALKEFCLAGYSKRISVAKYDNTDLKPRFLGAIILSLYRQFVASDYKISLKPIILFKSETIEASKTNQKDFLTLIENIMPNDIKIFFAQLKEQNQILKAKLYFEEKFDNNFLILIDLIKNTFSSQKILNVNSDKEKEVQQLLLNSLEDKENEIRVIFAVDKLNEGWDVLNLFDIVRLGSKKANPNTTTKETQLIGRGARYYPFALNENDEKFKRKYDNDLECDLSILERLTYHTLNDVAFIEALNTKMNEDGLLLDEFNTKKIILNPSKRAYKVTNDKLSLFFVGNSRKMRLDDDNIFKQDKRSLSKEIEKINIPLFSNKINDYELFKNEKKDFENKINEGKIKKFEKGKIEYNVFLKALNVSGLKFNQLKKSFDIKSKSELYDLISNLEIAFDTRQEFSPQNQLLIANYILKNINNIIKNERIFYITPFKINEITMKEKIILREKGQIVENAPKWLYYDKFTLDSNLEEQFMNFITSNEDKINKAFARWVIFRNEGFSEFKIFDHCKESPSYASGFEVDFIFFGARKENDKYLSIQGFFEIKGGIYQQKDKWKEDLLKIISGKYEMMRIDGFSFFDINENGRANRKFQQEFDEFLNNPKS